MRSFVVVPAVAAALALAAVPAHAYLDPGTGSYLVQAALAALVTAGFVVKAYWQRLRALFSRRGRGERTGTGTGGPAAGGPGPQGAAGREAGPVEDGVTRESRGRL